jgi:hypothetical protein
MVLMIVGLAGLNGLQWRDHGRLVNALGASHTQVAVSTDAAAKAARDKEGLQADVTELTAEHDSLTALVSTLQAQIRTLQKQTAALSRQLTAALEITPAAAPACPYTPAQLEANLKLLDFQEQQEVEAIANDFAGRGVSGGALTQALDVAKQRYDLQRQVLLAACPGD